MAETGAVFGGEHSGHYYFRDNYRADSGLIAAHGRARGALARPGGPLLGVAQPVRALRRLRRDQHRGRRSGRRSSSGAPRHYAGARQDRLDGLTVDLGDWWFNLRPSNTEPLLRLNLEAAPTAWTECRRPRRPRFGSSRSTPPCRSGVERLKAEPMALDPKLLEILACPEDKGPLLYFADEESLYNPR